MQKPRYEIGQTVYVVRLGKADPCPMCQGQKVIVGPHGPFNCPCLTTRPRFHMPGGAILNPFAWRADREVVARVTTEREGVSYGFDGLGGDATEAQVFPDQASAESFTREMASRVLRALGR
jgi:hypothetical protein